MGSTILVVEDDVNINETVSEYLKEAGFLVVSSVDGIKAENIIQSNFDVDLFILDIMLPGRSGLELLKIIRSMDEQKEKPVLMLTAIGDEMTQLLSFDGLADDYVTKPFSPGVLVKRV
ncbi:MAG: response regulator, partial [Bacillota bacterium]